MLFCALREFACESKRLLEALKLPWSDQILEAKTFKNTQAVGGGSKTKAVSNPGFVQFIAPGTAGLVQKEAGSDLHVPSTAAERVIRGS